MMPMAASVSMSLMLPVSMNSFIVNLTVRAADRDCVKLADAFDAHRHDVAWHRAGPTPGRRARRNDVARLERHHESDVLDEELDRKDQVGRARVLAALAVDASFDRAAGRGVPPIAMHGPNGANVSKPFARVYCDLLVLNVARRDVVQAGDAEDVVPRLRARHAVRPPADHQRQL